MKLALSREAQAWTSRPRCRQSIEHFHGSQTGTMSRLPFLLQEIRRFTRRNEQIAIEALEITIDLLLLGDFANLLNGGGVTLRRQPRALGAVQTLHLGVAIIDGVRQMRRRLAGLAIRDGTIVQHDHGLAC